MRMSVWVVAACLALGACASSKSSDAQDAGPGGTGGTTGVDRHGALPAGPAADCAAEYSSTVLAEMGFAFDGVVTAIGPATSNRGGAALPLVSATFDVRQWFHGGSAPTVSVDIAPPDFGVEDGPPAYGLGTRLLVSGQPRWGGAALDDPIAWACGFTRYYDPATADEWQRAFA